MPTDIPSFIWWFFSVIIIGILVGFVPAYLKPKIDEFLAKYFKSRREKLEREKREFEEQVNLLLTDVSEFIDLESDLLVGAIGIAMTLILSAITIFSFLGASIYITNSPEVQLCCGMGISGFLLCALFNQPLAVLWFVSSSGFYFIVMVGFGVFMYMRSRLLKLLDEYKERKREVKRQLVIESLSNEIIELDNELSNLQSKKVKTVKDEQEMKELDAKLKDAFTRSAGYDKELTKKLIEKARSIIKIEEKK
ncbi:MAG: hypothetical protein M1282_01410 [Chloroflexi bacterium]|nr:hypothetical protein [Chloroflexota bacterium]